METTAASTSFETTMDPLVKRSIEIFSRNVSQTILMGSFAFLTVITNAIVLGVILFTTLRTKRYFQLCLQLAIADFIVGLSYLFVSINRGFIILSGKGKVRNYDAFSCEKLVLLQLLTVILYLRKWPVIIWFHDWTVWTMKIVCSMDRTWVFNSSPHSTYKSFVIIWIELLPRTRIRKVVSI